MIRSSAPDDPYRVLFAHLTAGAARCRLVVERGAAVDAVVLDHNAGFDPAHLPLALELMAGVQRAGSPSTVELRHGATTLSASAYPVGGDEVMLVVEDITARERLERSSRESQNRFEQVFHGNAAAMVIAHHSDLRIIDVNARWLDMFGATRGQVIGRTSVELGLISEANARVRIDQHKQFVNGYDTELELRTLAGAPLTVLASAKPIVITEGRCTLTTLIDITARKYAEEAFAAAFNASPAGMLLVDATSELVVAVNRRMLEMTRATREDIVGHPAAELNLALAPSRAELMAEIERTGKLVGVEIQLRCKGGPDVWTLASAEVVTLHGKPHRLSVFTDITARKRVERRLLTQHRIGHSLAQTSELDTAIPRVLEALCRSEGWDVGAMWLRATDAGALQRSCTWSAEAVAAALADVQCDAIAASGVVDRVSATCAPERIPLGPAGHAIACPILRGTTVLGVLCLAAGNAEPEQDPADVDLLDSVGRMLGLFIARTRAELAVREMNLELERRVLERTHALETSNRDLEAFSSSVSHDLRAPLRAIHGFSRILLDDFAAELPAEAKNLLGRIHASESRLRRLIDDLLEFARLGRAVLHRRPVDLDALVPSVLDELLVGRGLDDRLELRIAPLGSCHADPTLVRAVWTNLLDNALKYARHRERIVIEIGRVDSADGPVYSVTDNGVGFDPRHADRLFGVFQRLHSEQEFEGTGIGLANVRRIIDHHQGRIAASSEPGRGTRFEFTFGGKPPARRRWFTTAPGDLTVSLARMRQTQADVEAHPRLRAEIEIVTLHEEGPDWISRDFDPSSLALEAGPAEAQAARARAIAELEAQRSSGGLSAMLADLLDKLKRRPAANLYWSPVKKRIVVTDMQ